MLLNPKNGFTINVTKDPAVWKMGEYCHEKR